MSKSDDLDFGWDALDVITRGKKSKAKPIRAVGGPRRDILAGTAKRTPEVMVKVSGGGKTKAQVYNHMTYITRNGNLEAVTEDGEKIASRDEVKELLRDWQVDSSKGYGKNRLAFNIVLSMPKGTPADGVEKAAREFARDNFWSGHRYLMVLHTDTDHPHVHVVVKAENEDATHRVHITKDVLKGWRENFAYKLQQQGIEANATYRDVRGVTEKSKSQAVYHAEKRGASTSLKNRVAEVAKQLLIAQEVKTAEPWTAAMTARRQKIVGLFGAAAGALRSAGEERLAVDIEKFARELPKIVTQNERISSRLQSIIKESAKGKALSAIDLTNAYLKEVATAAPSKVQKGEGKVVSHAKQPEQTRDDSTPKRGRGEPEQER